MAELLWYGLTNLLVSRVHRIQRGAAQQAPEEEHDALHAINSKLSAYNVLIHNITTCYNIAYYVYMYIYI